MTSDAKQKAASQLEAAVSTARWEGLTADEVRAVVLAALLKRGGS